jgi:hypothetical protein
MQHSRLFANRLMLPTATKVKCAFVSFLPAQAAGGSVAHSLTIAALVYLGFEQAWLSLSGLGATVALACVEGQAVARFAGWAVDAASWAVHAHVVPQHTVSLCTSCAAAVVVSRHVMTRGMPVFATKKKDKQQPLAVALCRQESLLYAGGSAVAAAGAEMQAEYRRHMAAPVTRMSRFDASETRLAGCSQKEERGQASGQ